MNGKERFSIFISQSVTGLIKVIYHAICLFLLGSKRKLISDNLRQFTSISLSFLACFQLVWDLKCFAQEERRTRIYPWMSCSTVRWSEATEWPSPLTPLTKCESRCNPTIVVSDDAHRAFKNGWVRNKLWCDYICRYEIMKRCWDETFEKRPDFSFLVHCVGDMLTDSYKKVLYLYIKLLFTL